MIVVLGGIGVWSVTRVFVRQKLRSVAILKCLGATTRQVLATYVLQVALLGLTGSLLGVGIAYAAIAAIPQSLTDALGGVTYGVTPSATLQGTSVGLLVSLLFSLVPLLEIRHVKPLLLLRGTDTLLTASGGTSGAGGLRRRVRSIDWPRATTIGLVSAALVAVEAWQAASLLIGAIVCAGFAAVGHAALDDYADAISGMDRGRYVLPCCGALLPPCTSA